MDTAALERIDSFPYRHRVAEVMSTPLVTLPTTASVQQAAQTMSTRQVSSVLMVDDDDGRPVGIVTERDVLRVAARGPSELTRDIASAMSSPVHAVAADAFVYQALARLMRLGVRHLAVLDETGRAVGMLTSRALLKQRASFALPLGDQIDQAEDSAALRAAHERLPSLAATLRRDDMPATQVSSVISGVVRDLTARAAELALARMRTAGHGAPPAPWCLLVLGSGGRGESLLAADQDNALIHSGGEAENSWFAAWAEEVNRLLDEAGVPLCKGGVMVRNSAFRRTPEAWRRQIDEWTRRPAPEALLNVDIFYDFAPVHGDRALAHELRRHALEAAANALPFLTQLAMAGAQGSALDFLGRLRTENGRTDLKLRGLLPIVASARAIALAWSCEATGTDARLAEAAGKGALPADAATDLTEARAVIVNAILDQQLADIAAGQAPSTRIDPRRLSRAAGQRLRRAVAAAANASELARDALANRRPGRAA